MIEEMVMKCYATMCNNRATWLVNARFRKTQSASCGSHLAPCVKDLASFNSDRYARRVEDHGVMVYPISR